jgi:hypothetical protein
MKWKYSSSSMRKFKAQATAGKIMLGSGPWKAQFPISHYKEPGTSVTSGSQ